MMKKAICILLALAVMMSCCVIGVSAKCTIGDELQAKMVATAEDEPIRVFIWIHPIYVSDDELHLQAMADAGFKIWEFDKLTSAEMSRYYSDFDRDGDRSILDVTRLQRYLISE